MTYVLAIDQGTTSTRAILFDSDMRAVGEARAEFRQHFPRSGWVEHDPEDLYETVVATCREVLENTSVGAEQVATVGIANQRETTVVWDRKTGKAVYPAIVWQDRRTSKLCHELREEGLEVLVSERTGLLIDPYFSATKLRWILDNVDGARVKAKCGELLFGTVDTYLIWRLTGGKVHATDATNVARTMLYDIHNGCWSNTICESLDIPPQMLPEVRDCAAEFGHTTAALFGKPLPILGVAGDQQASAIGHRCFAPGTFKATYGTGCFALLNTGAEASKSQNRLLTTIAYRLNGKTSYALEGSIFSAGAVAQWLRDGLRIIATAKESQKLASMADTGQGVVLVPAFSGLGAPYWDSECHGAIFGLTRGTGRAEIALAALQSVGFQSRDLIEAMRADGALKDTATRLRVDGGMCKNDLFVQILADLTRCVVARPRSVEATALGVAWLAGMFGGVYGGQEWFIAHTGSEGDRFEPQMTQKESDNLYDRWQKAVRATRFF